MYASITFPQWFLCPTDYLACNSCRVIIENRSEFLEKLEKARSSVNADPPQPILSKPSSSTVNVGNWCLISKKDGELRIVNTDGQQVNITAHNHLRVEAECPLENHPFPVLNFSINPNSHRASPVLPNTLLQFSFVAIWMVCCTACLVRDIRVTIYISHVCTF